jgi:uroporphyrinogen decarboxylase
MDARERIDEVLQGRLPDRPPFSFWYHFAPDQVSGPAAVEAHLEPFRRYGLDFIKVMNDNPYPQAPLHSPEDLGRIAVLQGTEDGFGRQLELISVLRREVGDSAYLVTTIFNPWAVLRTLVKPPERHLPPVLNHTEDPPGRWILDAFSNTPDLVRNALQNIGQSLSNFARNCISAGADGVFLSVRDDWVDSPGGTLYEQLVRATDLAILGGASSARLNILHVCGHPINFHAFAEYPVHAINWADRAAGPAIGDVKAQLKPAICGGIDNLGTLVTGTPRDVAAEVADAVTSACPRPLIVSPGCTFNPDLVSSTNLDAFSMTVRNWKYAAT